MTQDACFDPYARMTSVGDAWRLLEAEALPVTGTERVALADAAGRILAAPLVSPRDVPAWDNVAVDGFAFRAADVAGTGSVALGLLEGGAAAGHPWEGTVPPGHALKVLTGAPLPAGADTVAMWEECREEAGRVHVPAGYRAGAGRRRRGEDVRSGEALFAAGTWLLPQHLGVVAELGLAQLEVRRRLRVALLSSGDEVHEAGAPLPPGGLHDANRPMLRALLAGLPVELTDLGIVRDQRAATRERLAEVAGASDLVLATGGASRGSADHVVAAVAELGTLGFWQIRMKPGRPLALGRIGAARFVGLPGNPVAAFVGFLLFARPLLLALAGAPWRRPRGVPLPAGFAMRKQANRTEVLRVALDTGAGGPRLRRIAREGSGILTSLTAADGLALVEQERTAVAEGEPVEFLSWASLGVGAALPPG